MDKNIIRKICVTVSFILAFILWTIALCFIDKQAIGPNGSSVGFSKINDAFHNLTGSNLTIYNVTDWLGLVPIAFVLFFAVIGLCQLIKRKNILKVDYDILVLGCYYIFVLALYLLFEYVVVNYRPILIEGNLEVSYPSSTTLLTISVMATVIIESKLRIQDRIKRKIAIWLSLLFTLFMVVGRLISGVHWLTDIIGGVLLSFGLIMLFITVLEAVKIKIENNQSTNKQ